MIGRRELERRAAHLGISVQHVELDYVLNHLLAQIALDPRDLVFRGGTALARVYWPDFRISEDLDFISPGSADYLQDLLNRIVRRSAETIGLDLQFEFGRRYDDRFPSFVRWTAPWGTEGELLIDVVALQAPKLSAQPRGLVLAYSDLAGAPPVTTMDIHEILANKWMMLDDREEPRDLFDLWWGLARQEVRFENIAAAHRQCYGYGPMSASIERARRLGTAWMERLSHQLSDLPPFATVLATIEQAFTKWRETASS